MRGGEGDIDRNCYHLEEMSLPPWTMVVSAIVWPHCHFKIWPPLQAPTLKNAYLELKTWNKASNFSVTANVHFLNVHWEFGMIVASRHPNQFGQIWQQNRNIFIVQPEINNNVIARFSRYNSTCECAPLAAQKIYCMAPRMHNNQMWPHWYLTFSGSLCAANTWQL
jgi:hypothetical protein